MSVRGLLIRCLMCCSIFLALAGASFGQSSLDNPITHRKQSGNLPELLRFVAQQYNVPIIGELLQPLPAKLEIPAGTNSAIEAISAILKLVPNYRFEVAAGNVIHFYHPAVVDVSGNFLNLRIQRFTMPRDVSELKVILRARLNAAAQGLQGEGIVTSGFGAPELEKCRIAPAELEDVTGREVLLRAAGETRGFYSIVVFPNRTLRSEASLRYAYQHWFWGGLVSSERDTTMYIQKPPIDPM